MADSGVAPVYYRPSGSTATLNTTGRASAATMADTLAVAPGSQRLTSLEESLSQLAAMSVTHRQETHAMEKKFILRDEQRAAELQAVQMKNEATARDLRSEIYAVDKKRAEEICELRRWCAQFSTALLGNLQTVATDAKTSVDGLRREVEDSDQQLTHLALDQTMLSSDVKKLKKKCIKLTEKVVDEKFDRVIKINQTNEKIDQTTQELSRIDGQLAAMQASAALREARINPEEVAKLARKIAELESKMQYLLPKSYGGTGQQIADLESKMKSLLPICYGGTGQTCVTPEHLGIEFAESPSTK